MGLDRVDLKFNGVIVGAYAGSEEVQMVLNVV